VEDLVRELVHEANGDVKKAEYGIIYLDEIDKIASSGICTARMFLEAASSGICSSLWKRRKSI